MLLELQSRFLARLAERELEQLALAAVAEHLVALGQHDVLGQVVGDDGDQVLRHAQLEQVGAPVSCL